MTKGIKEMTLFVSFWIFSLEKKWETSWHTFHPLYAFLNFLCTSLTMHVNLEHHSDDLRRLQHNRTIESQNQSIKTKKIWTRFQIDEWTGKKKCLLTSSFFSSGLGFSSGFFSSSAGGFGIGDRSSTCLWLFLWTLSRTLIGSAFSPLTTTLWPLQSVLTSSTPENQTRTINQLSQGGVKTNTNRANLKENWERITNLESLWGTSWPF